MKVKIMALAIAFVLLVPGLNALANETENLLSGVPGVGTSTSTLMTDGNYSTSQAFSTGHNYTFTLKENREIVSLGFSTSANIKFTVDFLDSSAKILRKETISVTSSSTALKILTLNPVNDVKQIKITSGESYSYRLNEFEAYSEKPVLPLKEISNLSAVSQHDSVSLSWTRPIDERFKEVNIYRDNVKIATTTGVNYKDSGLQPETQYSYKITTVAIDGKESPGLTTTTKTKETPRIGEVKNLEVEKTHERVNLSWELPSSSLLKHVNIYRDEIKDLAFLDKVLGFRSVSAAATTKIFETNGTYFNDLTVKPETKYEYTLTTLDTLQRESAGVTTVVETEEEPAPEIVGGDFSTDPVSGDFIYTWKKPTTGQVKVKVDGQEYKTVDAADGKIIIPKEDMKYTKLGDPLVSVTPIGTNGKVGEEVKTPGTFDNIAMPFTVREMMMAALALFGIVGGITLLFLAFKFVPKWLALLKSSNRNGRSTAIVAEGNGRRFQEANSMEASAAVVKTPRELKVAAEKTERIQKAPRIPRAPKEPRVRQREPRTSQREPRRRRGE